MKNKVCHFTKKTACLMFATVLVFCMMITGCNKKDIKSEAQEETEQAEDKDTDYMLEVCYTKVDKAKLTVNKIEDLHESNEKAFIEDNLTFVSVDAAKDRKDMYMAKVDGTAINDVPGELVDYVFYSDGETKGMEYDVKKGIVYIPKNLVDKAGDGGLGIHLMMAVKK